MLVRLQNNSFHPAFDSDYEEISKLEENNTYEITIKKPRNIGFHRKYFGMLQEVVNNVPDNISFQTETGIPFPVNNVEQLHKLIKFLNGMTTFELQPNGVPQLIYKSIKFGKMSQEDFEQYYDDSINIICKRILVGSDVQEFKDHIRAEFG